MCDTLATAERRVRMARAQTFRESFQCWVVGEKREFETDEEYERRKHEFPTLPDGALALAYHVAEKSFFDDGEIESNMPEEMCGHLAACRNLMVRFQEGPRRLFQRFAVLQQLPYEGMLVGFGADDLYYVLATWDNHGADIWLPVQNEPDYEGEEHF